MGKAPAFQFYANDFIQGTSDFTLEERGAYVVLLCRSWDKGPLPNDLGRIAVMLGVTVPKARKLWAVIADKWTITDGGYVNLKLEQVRTDRVEYGAVQAVRAKKGWERRRGTAVADTGAVPGQCTSIFSLQDQTPPKDQEESGDKAPTKALLTLFDAQHRERFGTAAALIHGKDAAKLAAIWKVRGTEETERLIRAFFRLRDPWVIQKGFTVGIFETQIGKILAQKPLTKQIETGGVDPDVRQLCEDALLRESDTAWFVGATLERGDEGLTLRVPDPLDADWIRKHYLDALKKAAEKRGAQSVAVKCAA